jgi:hypothetical protein
MIVSRSVRVAVSALALVLGAAGANAQQILTALNTDQSEDDVDINILSTTAGQQISSSYGGFENRAVTNYGVNKIYANAGNGVEQSTTSAWLDTYTASGPAGSKVTLSFTFTIDGRTQFGTYPSPDYVPNYNFKVYAMRGAGWTMYGDNEGRSSQYGALTSGSDYDTLFLQRATPGVRVEQLAMREETAAMYNYANANGQPGNFTSQISYDEIQDVYNLTYLNPQGIANTNYLYKQYFRTGTPNGPISGPIPYNAPTPAAAQQAALRANLESGFSILDFAQLCSDAGGTCTGKIYEPTPLTVSFEVAAGSQFTLAAWLYSDGVEDATVDFFNTAKVTGITATSSTVGPVTLTSASGTLQALPGGGFGYPAATPGVPEPATWAMMIGGLGLIGGAMRRRRSAGVVLA